MVSVDILAVATLLGATALWLLLPHSRGRTRLLGLPLGAISLGLLASQVPRLGNWAADSALLILSAVTILSATATVCIRNPIYSAIWFGMTLVSTAGLFLLQGAEFLAVATVVVYAGAILVTFLFLLMLADPQGQAYYDRTSWDAALSAVTGAVIIGVLSITVVGVLRPPSPTISAAGATPEAQTSGVLAPEHVRGLGAALFERHLIEVEVAGVLLLAALVGAAAMVAQGRLWKHTVAPDASRQPSARPSRELPAQGHSQPPAEVKIPTPTEPRG